MILYNHSRAKKEYLRRNRSLTVVLSTKGNGTNKVNKMVGVCKLGLTGLFMKVTGKMDKLMEEVDLYIQMVMFKRVNG